MADHSWYRRKTWTLDDQTAFFARLRRSRGGGNKAQYCRVQAYELQQVGNFTAALELLELLMSEWPEDAEKAQAYHQMAECFVGNGRRLEAIAAYRLAFETQRKEPFIRTTAYLGFGLLVATSQLFELYDEMLAVLGEFEYESPFPVQEYKAAVARALILDAKGERLAARQYAKIAVTAASKTHSGFRYHAKLGLVEHHDSDVLLQIKRLAEG